MDKVKILNIHLDNLTKDELFKILKKGIVFTPNIDHLVKLQNDNEFFIAYSKADYRLCDSRVLLLKSRMGILPYIKEQLAGSDIFPEYCLYNRNNLSTKIFLLGGNDDDSLQRAIVNINRKTGREIIVGGYSPPFGFEQNYKETKNIIAQIRESEANVLAVGVGAPKQEKWIVKNKNLLPEIEIFFAIGATIEFQAGTLKRSPKLITKLGFEWAYRIYKEPKRLWKRYLYEDLLIFYLIILQIIGYYKNPWADNINIQKKFSTETKNHIHSS